MLKSAWAKLGVIIGVTIVIAGIVALVMPHYSVLQRTRSISIVEGVNNDFVMSPAKVKVYIPIKGQSLTIPVTIDNGEGETVFEVAEQNPAKFDNGYFEPNGDCGYKFVFSPSSLDLQGNTSGEVSVTIQRTAWHPQKHIEKGIAVSQTTNGTGISIVRSYVFEILN
jgi:hypothetical protein